MPERDSGKRLTYVRLVGNNGIFQKPSWDLNSSANLSPT